MNLVEYVDLVSRVGIKRNEIELWLLEHGDLLHDKRQATMQGIADLLAEADHALYKLQRRNELLVAELHNRELELKRAKMHTDRIIKTII